LEGLCVKSKQLAAMPVPGFAPQTTIAVGGAILLEWATPPGSVSVGVLQERIAGMPGVMVDFGHVHSRLVKIIKSITKYSLCSC
jgi:hypothetical protein